MDSDHIVTMDTNHGSSNSDETCKSGATSSTLNGYTREEKYHLAGWGMFVICSIFYIVAALEGESITSLMGGITFLLACFAFMIPLLWKEKQP